MRSDLLPLISEPHEDLAVEYKTWLDLGQEKDKATLAKACIALANHGGGFIVLGFDEDGDSLNSVAKPTVNRRNHAGTPSILSFVAMRIHHSTVNCI